MALHIPIVRTTNLDNNCDHIALNNQENVKKKISTTLKICNGTSKNIPENISEKINCDLELLRKSLQKINLLPTNASEYPSQKLKARKSRISSNQTFSILFRPQFRIGNNTKESHTKNPMSTNSNRSFEDASEELPQAHELKYETPDQQRRPYRRYLPRRWSSMNRRNVLSETSHSPGTKLTRRTTDPKGGPTIKECTFFTKTVCLDTVDYPREAILRSIRSNKGMVTALLADYKVKEGGISDDEIDKKIFIKYEDNPESKYENRFESNELKRRADYPFDNVEEGFTCPSQVKYGRPQLARAASGIWKYIINTGEHTQTLRLEKCSNPQSSCSFISENYRSSCVQVYNYHRLLTWDIKSGLHIDIFKVPTCCSCHVHGYAEIYPPHEKDPPSKLKESFPGLDFSIKDRTIGFDEVVKPSDNVTKYRPPSHFDNSFGLCRNPASTSVTSEDGFPVTKSKTPIIDALPNCSIYNFPARRLKKPTSISRPYHKLPQHHAPNTKAPDYIGSPTKSTRSRRPNRPYRRKSTLEMEDLEASNNVTFVNRFRRPYDQEKSSVIKKPDEYFGKDVHELHTRINYNYHPIIDFFTPQATMLQAELGTDTKQVSSAKTNSNVWKPVISS